MFRTKRALLLWTPFHYFTAVMVVVFVAEAAVMYLLPLLLPPDVDQHVEAFCDAAILTRLSGRVLWGLLIRPLRRHAERQSAELFRRGFSYEQRPFSGLSLFSSPGAAVSSLGPSRPVPFTHARKGSDLAQSRSCIYRDLGGWVHRRRHVGRLDLTVRGSDDRRDGGVVNPSRASPHRDAR